VSNRRRWLLVGVGAIALAGSYPPFPLPLLSFVAVIPAVLLLEDAAGDAGRAYTWGVRYGIVANGAVLSWMVVALWHFTPLAALGYVITTLLLGVFTGALFWFVVRVRAALPRVPLAFVFPVAWTALEWAVGHLGDAAFPWLGLGTSLADARVLVQWADLAGARGVTLWVVWANVLVAGAISAWGNWRLVARRLVPVAGTVLLAAVYGVWRERTLPLRTAGTVALIQPNVASGEKWEADPDSQVAALLDMSRQARAAGHVDLFLWPETALPGYLPEPKHADWVQSVRTFAAAGHTPVLTGSLDYVVSGGRDIQTYNAAFYFDSLGLTRPYEVYHKHYLVPVVERVPFVPVRWFRALPWLGRWSGGFAHGRELPVYEAAIGRFGVLVCYESAFEDLTRGYRRAGADFVVNITNDSWFGRTAGPYQHASHLVLRAIETRMGIARAANDGVSELVDPLGRASHETTLRTRTVVTGTLMTSDVRTLYVRLGDWVGLLVVVLTVGFAGAVALQRWRRGA
jgi:apolipoprotein N-acyltransferase